MHLKIHWVSWKASQHQLFIDDFPTSTNKFPYVEIIKIRIWNVIFKNRNQIYFVSLYNSYNVDSNYRRLNDYKQIKNILYSCEYEWGIWEWKYPRRKENFVFPPFLPDTFHQQQHLRWFLIRPCTPVKNRIPLNQIFYCYLPSISFPGYRFILRGDRHKCMLDAISQFSSAT